MRSRVNVKVFQRAEAAVYRSGPLDPSHKSGCAAHKPSGDRAALFGCEGALFQSMALGLATPGEGEGSEASRDASSPPLPKPKRAAGIKVDLKLVKFTFTLNSPFGQHNRASHGYASFMRHLCVIMSQTTLSGV